MGLIELGGEKSLPFSVSAHKLTTAKSGRGAATCPWRDFEGMPDFLWSDRKEKWVFPFFREWNEKSNGQNRATGAVNFYLKLFVILPFCDMLYFGE